MTKSQALIVVLVFGLCGLAVAYWGLSDILQARRGMLRCEPVVSIDNSAFYFLGLAILPLFAVLPLIREGKHTFLLSAIVALAILLPFAGYQFFQDAVSAQSYGFDPELSLFGLQLFEGQPNSGCVPQA